MTERTIIARSVRNDMFRKAARSVLSSTGERSPASQGVKIRPSHPAGAVAAKAVSASYVGSAETGAAPSAPIPDPPPSSPSCGATICSRNHDRAAPPVSMLLPTRFIDGSRPGRVAIECRTSVRLNGTRALSQAVVLMAKWVS